MAETRKKRPTDPIQRAKLIGDIATGQVDDKEYDRRDPRAVERGRLGGEKGGVARAKKLSKQRRREIARNAAQKRWVKNSETVD
jgi:hypothetical protein